MRTPVAKPHTCWLTHAKSKAHGALTALDEHQPENPTMLTPSHLFSPTHWRSRLSAEFIGHDPSWSAARAAARGYDDPGILQRMYASSLMVKRGKAASGRDSVCIEQEAFRWPLPGCLLHPAIVKQAGLHVKDFCGSLGSFYYQHMKFLQRIEGLQWSIVEQSNYVKLGRRDFEDILKFYLSPGDAATSSAIDIVLFSGSLQCVEDPFAHLREAARKSKWIILAACRSLTQRKTESPSNALPYTRFFIPTGFSRCKTSIVS
jgi:putative methyltransferase (TIGR04325 family)